MNTRWIILILVVALVIQTGAVLYPAANPVSPEVSVTETVEQPIAPAPIEVIPEVVPVFNAYQDVHEKKRAFFDFMLPLIRDVNADILADRRKLITLARKLDAGAELSGGERQTLKQLFRDYRMQVPTKITAGKIQNLLERADVVPASLVLAQSANESGWGTSRFAVEANNYFGIWCFRTGCGVTPKHRTAGLTHEVAKYDSVKDGVNAYMRTINTHRAYEMLRAMRAEKRLQQQDVTGQLLAQGLLKYSERGEDYVREIQAMIRHNKLEEYTLQTRA